MYNNAPHWIHSREALLQRLSDRRRQDREARRIAQERQDEHYSQMTERERKMEHLKTQAATSPCPTCGCREKAVAALTSKGMMAQCRDCGVTWTEDLS